MYVVLRPLIRPDFWSAQWRARHVRSQHELGERPQKGRTFCRCKQTAVTQRTYVAQGALAQAVQEHREWVKFDNLTQEHGPALQRVFFVLFLISLPSFQPWIPEPEFALLAAESELGLSGGASWEDLADLGILNQAIRVDHSPKG